jgi:hypothetical protein
VSERTPRAFTTDFKQQAVLRLEAGASASALAADSLAICVDRGMIPNREFR